MIWLEVAQGYQAPTYGLGVDWWLLFRFVTAPEWGWIGLLLIYGWIMGMPKDDDE